MSAPIRIGLAAHRSAFTPDLRYGVELALRDRNEGTSRPVEILWQEDGGLAGTAVLAAKALVAAEVAAVIGHSMSDAAIAASEVYHERGIVHVSTAASNPAFTDRGLWNVFRFYGRDDSMAELAVELIAGILGCETLLVVYEPTVYGDGQARLIERFAIASPLRSFHKARWAGADGPSSIPGEWRLRAEAVFFAGCYEAAGRALRLFRDEGYAGRFVTGDDSLTGAFIEAAGAATEGAYVIAPAPLPASAERLRERCLRSLGRPPMRSAINGYAAASVLLEAIGGRSTPLRGRRLAEQLRRRSWETPLGRIRFDDKGDLKPAPLATYRIEGGEFRPFRPTGAP